MMGGGVGVAGTASLVDKFTGPGMSVDHSAVLVGTSEERCRR